MSVIINDSDETTGGTMNLEVSPGQANHMLIGFTVVYQQWWYEAQNEIYRTAPSGGGGTWTAVDDQAYFYVFEYGRNRVRIHAWYSYPTETGTVSLNTGSYYTDEATGDAGRYSVFFSISNAEFDSYRSVSEVSSVVETFDSAFYQRQGSMAFAIAAAGIGGSPSGIGPFGDSMLSFGEDLLSENPETAYVQTCYGKHLSYYSSGAGKYWNQIGTRWGGSASKTVAITLAINSVECTI